MKFTHVFAFAAFAAASTAAPLAQAADPGFCRQYANLALHELRVNQETPGCFHGYDSRWHPDWRRHYEWCLGVSPATAAAERDYRRMRDDQCRARAGM